MRSSFNNILHEILREGGKPVEIFELIEKGLTIKPVKKAKQLLCQEIYRATQEKHSNFTIRQRPAFNLLQPNIKPIIPKRGYVAIAYRILSQFHSQHGNGYFAMQSIVKFAEKDFLYPILRNEVNNRCPEFWLYAKMLERKDIFGQRDSLKIGLRNKRIKILSSDSQKQNLVSRTSIKANEQISSITKNIHEANLESILAENLEYLEVGLKLIKRQFTCSGIGRIDILCEDEDGNLVVIELKKFGAKHDSIIDQIARYMGYIKKHVAKKNQNIRGIIIVGKIDEKLEYAVSAFSNIEVKKFTMFIE